MKGVIFTEFLDLVEEKFGYNTVDKIIEQSHLSSKGAYTAIGTYPHSEMVSLITNLSSEVNIPVSDLLKIYGRHLFKVLTMNYGNLIQNISSTFDLLQSIENHVHVEVRKIYPDAELPSFEVNRINDNELRMVYTSERSMSDFGVGLIESCGDYFNEKLAIQKTDLSGDGKSVLITVKKCN